MGLRHFSFVVLLAFLAHPNHADAKGSDVKNPTEQEISESLRDIAASYKKRSQRDEDSKKEERPCDPGKYKGNADLCAQWKAADATSDSAWWAWMAALAGAISTIAIAISLVIGICANRIARDTAMRQLRAVRAKFDGVSDFFICPSGNDAT